MSGNGVDLGTIATMLHTVIDAQERMRVEFDRRLSQLEQEVRGGLASVRGDVALFHGSVVAQGVLLAELESRLAIVEDHVTPSPRA